MNGLLAFDLVGPMAHFRRFYTNSSSLSYTVPPRTTVAGLLAALRGWERDSYYDAFAVERAFIGVAIKTPIRRMTQTVNYIRTKTPSEIDGSAGPTQVPIEFLLPGNGHRFLRYRVFFTHIEPEWVTDVYETLEEGSYRFPLYLGITECPAWVDNVTLYPPDAWHRREAAATPLWIRTAFPVDRLEAEGLSIEPGMRLYKERIPIAFDADRRLERVADVLFEGHGAAIRARLRGEFFETEEGCGAFLE